MENESKYAIAAPSPVVPPPESYALAPPLVETKPEPHQQQQQPNKRKAEEADLDAAGAVACSPTALKAAVGTTAGADVAAVTAVTTPLSTTVVLVAATDAASLVMPPTPTPTPPLAAASVSTATAKVEGSCAEMAIDVDTSSGEEDDNDAPADGAATIPPVAPATATPSPAKPSLSIRLPAAAVMKASGSSRRIFAGTGAVGAPSYAAQAAAASRIGGALWVKHENGGGGGAGSGSGSSPPSLKKCKAANGARQRGRPMGSKSRSGDEDPPFAPANPPQRGSSGEDDSPPIATSRPRRQTEPRKRWADQMMNPGEQWARKVPKAERPLPTNPVEASIPDAPTFYPSEEQFRDPLTYIEAIRPIAESYGIAKIVPPLGWKPPPTPLRPHARKLVPTKKQALHMLMNSDEVYDDGEDYTIVDYKMMADKAAKKWREREPPAQKPRAAPRYEPMGPNVEFRPGMSQEEKDAKIEENAKLRLLEREYWNVVDGGVEEMEVEYANDLNNSDFWSGFPMPPKNFMDGSLFDRNKPCNFDDPEYYRTCGWNLNNLPFWQGSVLRFFRTHINGLTAPWLYLGMQYATFAWHNEDNYLYSLNYHHSGAPKQWYGVPGRCAKGFEKCLAKILGETLETVSEHLYRITKMLSPVYLQEAQVPVCRLQQHAGQFVVTFPKAYHAGFSYGFNCGEAVNFGVPDWISYSRESTEAYRSASRMAALSHDKMVATLTMYLPDHDVKGCELVVRELRRIHNEELEHRMKLEMRGVQDPARQGVPLPRFRLGLIDRDTEEYDERRVCKTCKHTLFMTGVACPCSDVDVSCLRCVEEACNCPVAGKYLLSWWTEEDLSRFVRTAETYLQKLAAGQADAAAIASFRANINPF